jgi:hypothetical protein
LQTGKTFYVTLERGKMWLIVSSLVTIYVPIYVPLYLALGGVANTLVLVPVVLVVWIFGMRVGLLAGVLSYPLNILIAAMLAEGETWEILSPGSGVRAGHPGEGQAGTGSYVVGAGNYTGHAAIHPLTYASRVLPWRRRKLL